MAGDYVHGYDGREQTRLQDQAQTLEALIHADTAYPDGATVLEAGCGVGAQSLTLARNSPGAQFTSIDISPGSVQQATARAAAAGLTNLTFQQGDILALPFSKASFDHVFLCFVLEHLPAPAAALAALREVLKPGGTLTVVEGDHGSTLFHPDSAAAHAAIQCQIALQRAAGGNALIGREIYPLLREAGFDDTSVSPRLVYVDASRPALVDGFVRNTFTAMIEGVRAAAISAGLSEPESFDAGIEGLRRTTEGDGVFCYTFFKGVGRRKK